MECINLYKIKFLGRCMSKKFKEDYTENLPGREKSELQLILDLGLHGPKVSSKERMSSSYEYLDQSLGLVTLRPVTESMAEKHKTFFGMASDNAVEYREGLKSMVEITLTPAGHELYLSITDSYREKTGRSA